MEFIIEPEYESAVPPLSDKEKYALQESIRHRGQLNAIVINEDHVILDGHNRFQALMDLGLPVKYITKTFETEDEEYQFVVESNLNRRQLNTFQKIECYEKLILAFVEKGLENRQKSGGGAAKVPYAQGSSAKHFAEVIGVGQRQMGDAIFILKNGNEALKKRLRSGVITITEGKRLLSNQLPKPKGKSTHRQRYQCNKCFHIHERDELIIVKPK